MPAESYTLTEIARRLDVAQHRLIHLCEKGVVIPEVQAATGRGSSRVFSLLNYLELAVALRLRDMFIPVATLRGILHVLRRFGQEIGKARPDQTLVAHLLEKSSPELRIIVSDGRLVYFALHSEAGTPQLFGGIPLDSLNGGGSGQGSPAEVPRPASSRSAKAHPFGQPEGSEFVRLELSVNAVARSLQLD
jgi:DNA-binding transcriptional MerR regulator